MIAGRPVYLRDELDGVLDALGAAVGEDRLLAERAGRDLVEQLGEPHVRLVGRDQRADVDELPRLVGNRLDDRRRRVPDGHHADAAGEVDQRVAVDVEDERAFGAFDDDVGGAAEPGGNRRQAARDEVAGPRTGDLRVQSDVRHRLFP